MRASLHSLALLLWLTACGSDPLFRQPPPRDAAQPDAAVADVPSEDSAPLDPDAADAATQTSEDAEPTPDAADAAVPDAEPSRTEPPPLRPYSEGTCPTLTGGPTSASALNQGFISAGDSRNFRLLVPMSYDPANTYPLVFGWHWLNASGNSFVDDGELESAIEEMGFIAVLPDSLTDANGDKVYLFDWPFVEINNAEKELVFFDDLLTCVSEQYNIDRHRVYGIGVSAGALWLTHMMSTDRIEYLAAVESLSGGLGEVAGVWQIQFTAQSYKFPAIVLWGGDRDWLGVNFAEASQHLRDELRANGQFVVECVHDSGHAMPPIQPPPQSNTRFWSLWRFMLDHPYGTSPSPYLSGGLPAGFPDWCTIP